MRDFTAPQEIEKALSLVGELLDARGHRYYIVVIGGSAVNLLGLVTRATTDVDMSPGGPMAAFRLAWCIVVISCSSSSTRQPMTLERQASISRISSHSLPLMKSWMRLPTGFDSRTQALTFTVSFPR